MAKLTIMGDCVQIKTDITSDLLNRVKDYTPEALKLFDEDGNEVFGISEGNANYSKYGICFCSTDTDGKLFMSTSNPVTDHTDADKEREAVVRYFAPIVAKLETIEHNVTAMKEQIDGIEASVNESVTFA